MKWVRVAIPLSTAVALLYIDFQFSLKVISSGVLSQSTAVELGVFGLQVVKTAVALAVKRVRNAPLGVLVDYYGAELLVLPLLAGYYSLTQSAWAVSLLTQIVVGWIVGAAFATLPFVAYKVSISMARSRDLVEVLPLGTVAAEVGLVFAGAGATGGKGGLEGLLSFAFFGNGTPVAAAKLPVFVAATVLLCSLLLYALVGKGPEAVRFSNRAIAIGVIGTAACVAWIVGLSFAISSFVLILTLPTVCLVALSWWVGRAS